MSVPNTPTFSPLDPLPASKLAQLLANDQALAAGTALDTASVGSTKINFGGAGAGVWWEEIGRTTLSVAGDIISVTPITAKKYLQIRVSALQSGAIDVLLRFNNDSTNTYTYRASANGGGDGTAVTQGAIVLFTSETSDQLVVADVINIQGKEKLVNSQGMSFGSAGAGAAPTRYESVGKWVNTSAQITRIDIINDQAGDFAIGSELVVLGHN